MMQTEIKSLMPIVQNVFKNTLEPMKILKANKHNAKVNQNSYLAQCDASVQSVHEVVDVDQELGIKRVEPFG